MGFCYGDEIFGEFVEWCGVMGCNLVGFVCFDKFVFDFFCQELCIQV